MLRTTAPDRKIRLAIVGCGRIADKHFEAAKHHAEDIDLIAVCDPDPAALERAQERTGAAGFADLDVLLASNDAELIALCTPSGLHPSQTLRCANARRHVMTEKPMATRSHDGIAMVHACDEADVHLFVVKQNRHNPTLQLLRRAVRKGRFGRIYRVQVNVFWSRPQSYYDSSTWRGTWEFDGGALMNQASHYVDLLDWLIGPVQSVQAMTGPWRATSRWRTPR
jgi:UDP-N-acetyl-2-amino-2-deoxyglucuronate dehydrogenase